MDDDYERLLPDRIFGLSYWQHRVHQTIQFLTYNKAKFNRKARKAQLLNHLAALEKTFFTPEEQEGISAWFRAGGRTAELEPLIGAKREDANFVKLECSVCMAVLPSYYFPQEKLAANCDHAPSVCLMCFAQSLEEQIEEKAWDQVACPECPERLTFNVVKKFATTESFLRYDKKSVLAAFRDMPNFIMCLGPNCNSGQIHEGGHDQPIVNCITCRFKTCFTHQMPWHAGLTCEQYDAGQVERNRQEAASAEFLATKTKVCPNPRCGVHVDKYTGCDHVQCSVCNYEFCWICLASYEDIREEGNAAHSTDCIHHTNHLNGIPGHF